MDSLTKSNVQFTGLHWLVLLLVFYNQMIQPLVHWGFPADVPGTVTPWGQCVKPPSTVSCFFDVGL
jgi:hypothetical protein